MRLDEIDIIYRTLVRSVLFYVEILLKCIFKLILFGLGYRKSDIWLFYLFKTSLIKYSNIDFKEHGNTPVINKQIGKLPIIVLKSS